MDYTTSHVFYVGFLALYATALSVLAFRFPRIAGTRFFAISVVFELGKTMLQSLGYNAPRLLTILLANELNVTAFFFLCLGMRWFAGQRDRRWNHRAAGVTAALMLLYVWWFLHRVPHSFAVMGLPVLLLCGASVRAAWRSRRERFRAPTRVVAGLLVAQMVLLGYRIGLSVEAYRSARMVRLTWSDPRWMYSMLGLMVVGAGFLATYLWLTAIEIHTVLAERAERDDLTGCLNRASLMERAPRVLARYAQQKRPASVVMLDLDHFKAINDTWGHAAGDAVLRAVAQALRETLGEGQLLARIGGEEFAVVLADGGAMGKAESLVEAVRRVEVSAGGCMLEIRISGGLAEVADDESWEDALLRADQALYRAKAAGRDCVVRAQAAPRTAVVGARAAETCGLELSQS